MSMIPTRTVGINAANVRIANTGAANAGNLANSKAAERAARNARALLAPFPYTGYLDRYEAIKAFNQALAADGKPLWEDPWVLLDVNTGQPFTDGMPNQPQYVLTEADRRGLVDGESVRYFHLPGLNYLLPPPGLQMADGTPIRNVLISDTKASEDWLWLLKDQEKYPPTSADWGRDIVETGIPEFLGEGWDMFHPYEKSRKLRIWLAGFQPDWDGPENVRPAFITADGLNLTHNKPYDIKRWIENYTKSATAEAAAASEKARQDVLGVADQRRIEQAALAAHANVSEQIEATRYLVQPEPFQEGDEAWLYLANEAKRQGVAPWQLPGLRYLIPRAVETTFNSPPDVRSVQFFRKKLLENAKTINPVDFFQMLQDVSEKGPEYAAFSSDVLHRFLDSIGYPYSPPVSNLWSNDPIVDWIWHLRDSAGECGPDPDRPGQDYLDCTPALMGLNLHNYFVHAIGDDAAEKVIQGNEALRRAIDRAIGSGAPPAQVEQLKAQLAQDEQTLQQRVDLARATAQQQVRTDEGISKAVHDETSWAGQKARENTAVVAKQAQQAVAPITSAVNCLNDPVKCGTDTLNGLFGNEWRNWLAWGGAAGTALAGIFLARLIPIRGGWGGLAKWGALVGLAPYLVYRAIRPSYDAAMVADKLRQTDPAASPEQIEQAATALVNSQHVPLWQTALMVGGGAVALMGAIHFGGVAWYRRRIRLQIREMVTEGNWGNHGSMSQMIGPTAELALKKLVAIDLPAKVRWAVEQVKSIAADEGAKLDTGVERYLEGEFAKEVDHLAREEKITQKHTGFEV